MVFLFVVEEYLLKHTTFARPRTVRGSYSVR